MFHAVERAEETGRGRERERGEGRKLKRQKKTDGEGEKREKGERGKRARKQVIQMDHMRVSLYLGYKRSIARG